jgi:hypothetical protein
VSRQAVVDKIRQWLNESDSQPKQDVPPSVTPPEPALPQLHEQLTALRHCEVTVLRWWPELWPVVDAALSAITTLRLGDIEVGIPLFLIGRSGTGKSRVCDFIGNELTDVVVWRDSFTTASLQGHAQSVDTKTLNERSLIRVCKDKALIVPELAWLRTGTEVHQQERYASLLQWMDGKGRISDSSIHGAIGDRGLYPTVLLAGSTPLKKPTWDTMGQLGPRLLMYVLERHDRSVPQHLFKTAMEECKAAAQGVLKTVFYTAAGQAQKRDIPSSSWPSIDAAHDELLGRYSAIAALGQGFKDIGDAEYEFPTCNQFRTRLTLVVLARALLHGRVAVDESDMEMARWIARSSTPQSRGAVLLELFEGCTTASDVARRARLSLVTVGTTLKELKEKHGAVTSTVGNDGRGRPSEQWRIDDDAWDKV